MFPLQRSACLFFPSDGIKVMLPCLAFNYLFDGNEAYITDKVNLCAVFSTASLLFTMPKGQL